MNRASINRRTWTMDYRKANAADGGHSTTRRRFAAGFWVGGGRIAHISTAELKKVRRYIPRGSQVQPWRGASVPAVRAAAPCTGHRGYVTRVGGSRHRIWVWMNSWETINVVAALNGAAVIAGILTITPLAIYGGVICAMLALGAIYLDWRQSQSQWNAVKVEDYWHIMRAWPQ
jgi:hypothetical protein